MRRLFLTAIIVLVVFGGEALAQPLELTPSTFSNPSPGNGDKFGHSVAGAGNKVLVGAPGAREAYLFEASTGEHLWTYVNPFADPDDPDQFGFAVAMMGDKVLIGAHEKDNGAFVEAGAAYLFNTSGDLLHAFADPTPFDDEQFGFAVAFVGDNVLIGSPFDNTVAFQAGAAYLFDSLSGDRIQTFTSPSADAEAKFGYALAGVGNNVLIGAPLDDTEGTDSGAAYLFTSSSTITLANPNPASTTNPTDKFGEAVAAAGNFLVVAAPGEDALAPNAGAVYLFSGTSGAPPLHTLLNPTAAGGDAFGTSVAGLGSSGLVLVGTPEDDLPVSGAGTVYLFDGTMGGPPFQTLSNPDLTPPANNNDNFGFSIAVIGNNVLIGTPNDETEFADSGTAYLYVSTNEPPIANAGADQTLECTSPAGAAVTLNGSGSSDPDNDLLTYTWSENGIDIPPPINNPVKVVTLGPGSHTIKLTVDDGHWEPATDSVSITILCAPPNAPPLANAGADQTLECTSLADNAVTLNGSGSSDPDNDQLTYTWRENEIDIAPPTNNPVSVVTLDLGSHTIELTVADGNGETDLDTVLVTIADTTPPTITLIGVSPMTLECNAPFIDPGAQVSDNCDPSLPPVIPGAGTVNSNVPGTYTITYTATDASGNSSPSISRTVNVECPLPYPFVLLAEDKIIIDHQLTSEGDIHSNDDIELRDGSPSTHTGNVTAVDNIQIKKDHTIDGDVTAGGSLALDNNSTITGTATSNATVAPFPLPTFNFTDGQNNVTVPANGSLSLAPGSYNDVKVEIGGNLLLSHNGSSGKYFLHKLDVRTFARLSIDVSQGPVEINMVQKLHFEKDVAVIIAPATAASSRLVTFNVKDNDEIHIHDRSIVAGTVNAPKSKVILFDAVFFKGAVSGKEIQVLQNVTCLHHNSSGSAPLPKSSTLATDDVEECSQNESENENAADVKTYQLGQNYPNPFNPETEIRFQLPEAGHVVVKIFNTLGAEIRTLADGSFAAGFHSLRWNGRNDRGEKVQSGMYFYRLVTPMFSATRKMILAE